MLLRVQVLACCALVLRVLAWRNALDGLPTPSIPSVGTAREGQTFPGMGVKFAVTMWTPATSRNGKPLRFWVRNAEILAGGEVDFRMERQPNPRRPSSPESPR